MNAGRSSSTSSSIKRRSTPTSIEAVQGALARIEPVSLETMGLLALNFETIHRIDVLESGSESQTNRPLGKAATARKVLGRLGSTLGDAYDGSARFPSIAALRSGSQPRASRSKARQCGEPRLVGPVPVGRAV
jgi:hypothetical protein